MNTTSALMRVEHRPEDRLLEKADELEIYTSSQDRMLIKSAGSVAIAELPEAERSERVGNVLRFVFLDLGIKAAPTKYDVERMVDFMGTHHGKITTADLKAAFEMYLAGKLEGQLPQGHGHFQQFSVAFYAPILRAYMRCQDEARGRVRHKVQGKQLQLAAPTEPKERVDFNNLTMIRAQVARIVSDGVAFVQSVGFTFDRLVVLGICTVVDPPTEDEKVHALRRLREQKGRGVAFTWKMQRVLAGDKVDDVEWEAITYKRERALFAQVHARGAEAVAIIDRELDAIRARAQAAGVELETAA